MATDNGFIIGIGPEKIGTFRLLTSPSIRTLHKNEAVSEIPSFSNGCGRTSEKSVRLRKIGTAPADSLNLIPDSGFLIPDPSLRPRLQERRRRILRFVCRKRAKAVLRPMLASKVEMTPDWQPDLKVLDDHLKFWG